LLANTFLWVHQILQIFSATFHYTFFIARCHQKKKKKIGNQPISIKTAVGRKCGKNAELEMNSLQLEHKE